MIRKIEPAAALKMLLSDDNVQEVQEKEEYKRVHDSFQSIFDVELGNLGLTMEDVRRLQSK